MSTEIETILKDTNVLSINDIRIIGLEIDKITAKTVTKAVGIANIEDYLNTAYNENNIMTDSVFKNTMRYAIHKIENLL